MQEVLSQRQTALSACEESVSNSEARGQMTFWREIWVWFCGTVGRFRNQNSKQNVGENVWFQQTSGRIPCSANCSSNHAPIMQPVAILYFLIILIIYYMILYVFMLETVMAICCTVTPWFNMRQFVQDSGYAEGVLQLAESELDSCTQELKARDLTKCEQLAGDELTGLNRLVRKTHLEHQKSLNSLHALRQWALKMLIVCRLSSGARGKASQEHE